MMTQLKIAHLNVLVAAMMHMLSVLKSVEGGSVREAAFARRSAMGASVSIISPGTSLGMSLVVHSR